MHAARLVTFLAAMEDLTCAVAGAQILATAEFSVIHGTWLAAKKRPRHRIASAIGAQVGAARKQSPHRGSTLARTATTLVGNLPHTLAALFDGRITEYRASLIAARAGWLSDDLQRELDQKIAAHLTGAGDARIADLATGIAYRLDPQGAADRVRGAFTDRHVSIRPAPDTMVRLSALLPVTDGVAVYAALRAHADQLIEQGDPRNIGQIMADELITRLANNATQAATATEADSQAATGAGSNTSDTDPDASTPDAEPSHEPNPTPQPSTPHPDRPADPATSANTSDTDHEVSTPTAQPSDPEPEPTPAPADGCGLPDADAEDDAEDEVYDPHEVDADDCDITDPGPATPAGRAGANGPQAAALGLTAATDAAKQETSPVAGGLGRSLEVLLIMTDHTLLGGNDPAHLIGYGAITAALARDLALGRRTGALDPPDRIRIRRMFTDPAGRLVAMESRSRTFTPGMRRFLLARDQRCRNPWCNSPIAHGDHTRDRAHGGPTTLPNGNGKCARCNLDKNTGFTNTTTDNGHTITVTTPTGHTYRSTAPPAPGTLGGTP